LAALNFRNAVSGKQNHNLSIIQTPKSLNRRRPSISRGSNQNSDRDIGVRRIELNGALENERHELQGKVLEGLGRT